jgi:anthranilate phosphoribosyltransferase
MTQSSWPEILTTALSGDDLTVSQAEWAMRQVMQGEATDAQLGGLLMALRAKGEAVTEVIGFRDAILDAAIPLPVTPNVLDIVGTGGDRYGTVNISSTASIIVAACGVPVVKHGNRAVSSKAGSSDVLSALGIDLRLAPDAVARVLDEAGITFAWAAAFHPGFKHAAGVRAERGVPTVFNFLGPRCDRSRLPRGGRPRRDDDDGVQPDLADRQWRHARVRHPSARSGDPHFEDGGSDRGDSGRECGHPQEDSRRRAGTRP